MIQSYRDKIKRFTPNARVFFFATAITRLAGGAFAAIYNIYLLEAGLSLGTIGMLASVRMIAGGLASVPAGLISDRIGHRRMIIATSILAFFGRAGRVSTLSPILLVVIALFEGTALTARRIAQAPFLAVNSEEEERTHLFSSLFAANNLSGVVGSALGGFLPAVFVSLVGLPEGVTAPAMRWTLFIAVAITGLAVLPLFRLKELSEHQVQPRQGSVTDLLEKLTNLAKSETVRALAITNALIGLGAGLILPLFNVFLTEHLEATTAQVGSIMAITRVVTMVMVLLGPSLVDAIGKVRTVAYGQLASVPFILGMGFGPTLSIVGVASWFRAATIRMSSPVQDTFTMEIVPEDSRGTVFSLIRMARTLAQALGVSAAGYMMEAIGYQSPYAVAILVYALSSLWFLLAFKDRSETQVEEGLSSAG